jgi:hypothetical protein
MTARILREYAEHGMDAAVKLYRETVIETQPAHGRWSDENIRKHILSAMASKEGYSGVVTSPPYGDSMSSDSPGGIDWTKQKDGRTKPRPNSQGKIPNSYSGVVTSPPYAESSQCQDPNFSRDDRFREGDWHPQDRTTKTFPKAPKSDGQIGNLRDPSGDIHAVVSSPPYGDVMSTGEARGKPSSAWVEEKGITYNKYSGDRRQIGNFPDHPLEGVVTSPPYPKPEGGGKGTEPRSGDVDAGLRSRQYTEEVQGDTEGQVANLPYRSSNGAATSHGETYLAAMLAVYRELWHVLKPGGVVCLVTKNPVRNGAIRRLDTDTIRIMELAGFTLIERLRAMLSEDLGEQMTLTGEAVPIRRERKSFFKRLFERRYPDLRVDHEDVLWFRKN